MKPQITHNGIKAVEEQSRRFFSRGEFVWKKSKEDVWFDLEKVVANKPVRVVQVNFALVKWAAAAVLILLVGAGFFIRLATKTVEALPGQHLALALPDGSEVELNAQSKLSYHPYWWRFDRVINFEGEAFFQVQKGKRFRVISGMGTTEVLGTRFNVFSRGEAYKVTCIEGSVKVVSTIGDEVILKPSDKATIHPSGSILLQREVETLPEISWKDQLFFFTAAPISDVFSEIGRQYGVFIDVKVDMNELYTGNFSKNQKVEEVLGYICPAMGYKFIRKSEISYTVIPDPK